MKEFIHGKDLSFILYIIGIVAASRKLPSTPQREFWNSLEKERVKPF
jgi:hypothetical protein